MSTPSTPQKPPEFDALEFEITDFDEARRVLDQLPAGLEAVHARTPGYWERLRRPPAPSDRALTGHALDWLVTLPADVRPHTTCEQFPRVANAIAESWRDAPQCMRVLDHMINDYRGGRRGFPPAVQTELALLMRHQQLRPRA